jgi:acyl-CoA synthetase (AMP-forming)/AMP-acid ligase II
MTVLNYPCLPVKPGSMGQPIPGTHFEILSDDDVILGSNQVGHLSMRLPSPQFMLGYWNNPARTRESIRTIDGVDYWLTGDLSSRDAQGYLFYAGRSDDMISSAGYRIGPTEVENALIEQKRSSFFILTICLARLSSKHYNNTFSNTQRHINIRDVLSLSRVFQKIPLGKLCVASYAIRNLIAVMETPHENVPSRKNR